MRFPAAAHSPHSVQPITILPQIINSIAWFNIYLGIICLHYSNKQGTVFNDDTIVNINRTYIMSVFMSVTCAHHYYLVNSNKGKMVHGKSISFKVRA